MMNRFPYKNFSLKNLKDEVWVDVPNFEKKYQVSNLGRAKSLSRKIWNGKNFFLSKEKILKQKEGQTGYLSVKFHLDHKTSKYREFSLHSLVLDSFVKKRTEGMVIDHIDCDKKNNKLSNLEYCSHKENMQRAYKNNLMKINYEVLRENNDLKKVKIKQVEKETFVVVNIYESINDAIKKTGFTSIGKVLTGQYKSAGGFLWERL
jgi:hypothetical protein